MDPKFNGRTSNRDMKTEELSKLINQGCIRRGQIYGSPLITIELNKENHKISRSYVARLMKRMDLRSKIRKKFKITTDLAIYYEVAEKSPSKRFFSGWFITEVGWDIT